MSVPDDIFQEVEELARRTKRSRSEVYGRAPAEYVACHAPDRVTEALALAEIAEPADDFVRTASRRVLERSDWCCQASSFGYPDGGPDTIQGKPRPPAPEGGAKP